MKLTRDEQRVARALGSWMVLDVLTWPDNGRTDHTGGATFARGFGEGFWLDYTPRHIVVTREPLADCSCESLRCACPREVVASVKWTAIQRHGRTLSDLWRAEALAHRRAAVEHQREFPRFEATGAAAVHSGPRIGPPTYAEHLREEQYAVHYETVWLPYVHDGRRLRAVEEDLLDRALPLACEAPEPTDLLELLGVVLA